MIKLLILFSLFFFLFFKIGGFLFRTLFGSASQRHNRNFNTGNQPQKRWQPKDGNLNVDYDPTKPRQKGSKDYNDGEYVDYEEVK